MVTGEGVPKPCLTFDEASMPEYILSEVKKCGFDKPTPIQSQGWPMALKGKNMVGISATGSGKTLAFLLPAMIHINAQVRIKKECGACGDMIDSLLHYYTFSCDFLRCFSWFRSLLSSAQYLSWSIHWLQSLLS